MQFSLHASSFFSRCSAFLHRLPRFSGTNLHLFCEVKNPFSRKILVIVWNCLLALYTISSTSMRRPGNNCGLDAGCEMKSSGIHWESWWKPILPVIFMLFRLLNESFASQFMVSKEECLSYSILIWYRVILYVYYILVIFHLTTFWKIFAFVIAPIWCYTFAVMDWKLRMMKKKWV